MTDFAACLEKTKEYGIVEEIRYPIVICSGLPGAFLDELIYFETGELGQVLLLDEGKIEVVLFSKYPIGTGIKAARSGEQLSVPVGDHLIGSVIDPLGKDFYDQTDFSRDIKRPLDSAPLPIGKRKKITRPFYTGVSLIDSIIPLGAGQREMIIGDRQTGKTWILLNILRAQAEKKVIVIHTLIGKEANEISNIRSFIKKHNLSKQVLVVATDSDDSPSLIALTPYTAMTIAEYFRDQGKDVVVLFDDLSTHAIYYREIALLARRFPGRDSYPGDMFYKHARLLERAGNFMIDDKEVSITCLTIASTVGSHLTGHVVSNLIGITDGHLYFDSELFNSGHRPAIHPFLSVTRVGKQTQNQLERLLQRAVMDILSEYNELQDFAHFGAELPVEKKEIMSRAEKIYQFFTQTYEEIVPREVQIVMLGMILRKMLDTIELSRIREYRVTFSENFRKSEENTKKIIQMCSNEALDSFFSDLEKNDVFLLSLCTQKP